MRQARCAVNILSAELHRPPMYYRFFSVVFITICHPNDLYPIVIGIPWHPLTCWRIGRSMQFYSFNIIRYAILVRLVFYCQSPYRCISHQPDKRLLPYIVITRCLSGVCNWSIIFTTHKTTFRPYCYGHITGMLLSNTTKYHKWHFI